MTRSHAKDNHRPTADVVIINARVYTMNPKQAWAEAIAVRGDEILAVGNAKDVEAPHESQVDAKKMCSKWL